MDFGINGNTFGINGKGFGFYSSYNGGGGYNWIDADAESYYNAVTLANGGDIDTLSIYGIELDTAKSLIDNRFIALKAQGIYSKLIREYIYFGGTAATHAISTISKTSELLYVNTPLHGSLGMITNGTNQYASMNNSLLADVTSKGGDAGNWSIGIKLASSNSRITMGGRDSAPVGAAIRWRAAQTLIGYATNTTIMSVAPITFNHFIAISVQAIGTSEVKFYVDNSLLTTANSFGDIPSLYPTLIAAWGNGGVPLDYSAGSTNQSHVSLGLTGAQVSAYNNIINIFNSGLGR